MDEQKTKQHMEEPEPIDLTALLWEFLRIFTRMFWVPLVLAVLAGGLLWLRSWRSYTPMYRSEATFTVQLLSNQYDITGVDSYYDKAAAEQLANTFPYLLSSDLMQQLLQRELGVTWLNGSITAQSVENTNLFSVQVTSTSAQDACDILNGVIAVYPQVANYVVGSTELTVLVPPAVASQPYNAFQPTRTIIKGAVLGFGVGVVFLLVLAMASKTIRTREDMKKWMNVPCLGTLPTVSFKRRTGKTGGTVTILNDRTGSAFQESIRSLRIRFLREAERQESKVFLVSSTVPGEGKTTVAVNLALTLGQNGARVILVDMDLRKPSVKKALGLTAPSKGVPELLRSGEESPKAALMELEGTRVRVLAGDKAVENPRRQLESRKLSGLIKGPAGRGRLRGHRHAAQRPAGRQHRHGHSGRRNSICGACGQSPGAPHYGQHSAALQQPDAPDGLRAQRREGERRRLRVRLWIWLPQLMSGTGRKSGRDGQLEEERK